MQSHEWARAVRKEYYGDGLEQWEVGVVGDRTGEGKCVQIMEDLVNHGKMSGFYSSGHQEAS